jgi:hypothetical protein
MKHYNVYRLEAPYDGTCCKIKRDGKTYSLINSGISLSKAKQTAAKFKVATIIETDEETNGF